jgi:outer membrane protein OmpA-like peptidoglycan-associated protein
MKNKILGMVAGAAVLMAAGCASLPEQIAELDRARAVVETVDLDPMAEKVAGSEIAAAKQALMRADAARRENADIDVVKHEAYLAQRNAEIAQELIGEAKARERIDKSEAERTQVLLEARTVQAQRAEAQAARQGQLAESKAEEAEWQRERAERALEQAQDLEESLAELKAEQTERGLVLTLSDVLFDTDRAELKPGASAAIDQLSAFLEENPERRLLIEGHTDARGPDEYNRSLSAERAEAVRQALIEENVAPNRLRATGMGEAYPVASNETSAGRQQNRRVEIIVSDQDGEFVASAERS